MDKRIYVNRRDLGYDGDEWGNEWELGFCVFTQPNEQGFFEVYEDDGKGNGNQVAEFPSIAHALAWINGSPTTFWD